MNRIALESFRAGLRRSYLDRMPVAGQSISFLESIRSNELPHTFRAQCAYSRAAHGRCVTPPPTKKVRATPDRETRPVLSLEVCLRTGRHGSRTGLPEHSRWGVRSVDRDWAKTVSRRLHRAVAKSKPSLSLTDFVICLAPTPTAKCTVKVVKTEKRSYA